MQIAQTLAEVAKHFGRHVATIKAWRAAGMPGSAGAYDLDSISEWREQQTVDPLREMRAEKLAAEISLKLHQCEIARLKAEQLAGAAIPRRWVEQKIIDPVLEAISYASQNNHAVANSKMKHFLQFALDEWYALNDPQAGAEVEEGDGDATSDG